MSNRGVSPSHDVAIVGLGTMGSYAALELVRRGHSVIGFDQYAPPHSRGSHSGESRIYRIAYPEGSNYVPLVKQAGRLWDDLGEQFNVPLLHRTGMLHMGPADGSFIGGVAESARANALDIAQLSATEVRARYPAFQIPDSYVGLFDPNAGWLDVHAALKSSLKEAKRLGATIQLNTKVLGWNSDGSYVTVRTADREYSAHRLIIVGGAWAASLMQDLKLPLIIRRKVLTWFEPRVPEVFAENQIPVFTFPERWIYGFPNIDGLGVKLAEHLDGVDLASIDDEITEPGPEDTEPIQATIAKYMPALGGASAGDPAKLLRAQVCLYSLTPDEDFIIDRHPLYDNVSFAAGFSGHGFKFAPIVGQALADLAIERHTGLEIGFLGLSRFTRMR